MENRFSWCEVPPESNANFAFVLTGLDQVDERAVYLLPCGVLTSGVAQEKAIREKLIENNLLDAVITLPNKMFESTDIPTCLLVFDKKKKTQTVEMIDLRHSYSEEVRDQNGQYGGKSHEGRTYHKTVKILTDEVMKEALECIRERKSIPELCRAVTIEDIREQEYILTPQRYIELPEKQSKHREFTDIAADYNRIVRAKNAIKLTVNGSLAKSLDLYDVLESMQAAKDNDLAKAFELVGQKAEKEDFVTLSKNAAEFKIENKSKDRVPEVILLFLNMWKQHIMYLNNEENIILAEFRDALLPELMSGNIKVQ
jgi:hypothetical protein